MVAIRGILFIFPPRKREFVAILNQKGTMSRNFELEIFF